MPPAARITDLHTCPILTALGIPPTPITGPGVPNVLIAGMPASVLGDMCVCWGPPDPIIKGSMTVMIGGRPAVRMGDSTSFGGVISLGAPTVMIGG